MFLNCFALKIKALWSFKYQPTIFQLKWCNIPKDFCVFSSTNVRTSKLANMTKQIGVFFNLCCESITKTGQGNCKECDMLNVQPSILTLFILKKTEDRTSSGTHTHRQHTATYQINNLTTQTSREVVTALSMKDGPLKMVKQLWPKHVRF